MIVIFPGSPIPLHRHRSIASGNKIINYDDQKKEKNITRKIMVEKKLLQNTCVAKNNLTNQLNNKKPAFEIDLKFYFDVKAKTKAKAKAENKSENKDATEESYYNATDETEGNDEDDEDDNNEDEDNYKQLHVKKPDIDNCIKYILDCGNGVLWDDDCQIVKIVAEKCISNIPRTEMVVKEITSKKRKEGNKIKEAKVEKESRSRKETKVKKEAKEKNETSAKKETKLKQETKSTQETNDKQETELEHFIKPKRRPKLGKNAKPKKNEKRKV